MAGAVPLGGVGAGFGYLVSSKEKEVVTVRSVPGRGPELGAWHVCFRRTSTWMEIVAEFQSEAHANYFADAVREGLVAVDFLPDTCLRK